MPRHRRVTSARFDCDYNSSEITNQHSSLDQCKVQNCHKPLLTFNTNAKYLQQGKSNSQQEPCENRNAMNYTNSKNQKRSVYSIDGQSSSDESFDSSDFSPSRNLHLNASCTDDKSLSGYDDYYDDSSDYYSDDFTSISDRESARNAYFSRKWEAELSRRREDRRRVKFSKSKDLSYSLNLKKSSQEKQTKEPVLFGNENLTGNHPKVPQEVNWNEPTKIDKYEFPYNRMHPSTIYSQKYKAVIFKEPIGNEKRQALRSQSAPPRVKTSNMPGEQIRPWRQDPSKKPTTTPSKHPAPIPSKQPAPIPSKQPTIIPFKQPTKQHTATPSKQPTTIPFKQPTTIPSKQPTIILSKQPTVVISKKPEAIPPKKQPTAHVRKPVTSTNAAHKKRHSSRKEVSGPLPDDLLTQSSFATYGHIAHTKRPKQKSPSKVYEFPHNRRHPSTVYSTKHNGVVFMEPVQNEKRIKRRSKSEPPPVRQKFQPKPKNDHQGKIYIN